MSRLCARSRSDPAWRCGNRVQACEDLTTDGCGGEEKKTMTPLAWIRNKRGGLVFGKKYEKF